MPEILKNARADFYKEMAKADETNVRLVSNRDDSITREAENVRAQRPAAQARPAPRTPAAEPPLDPSVRQAASARPAGAHPNLVPRPARRAGLKPAFVGAAGHSAHHGSSCTDENFEARRCFGCGHKMFATRYRRSLVRFARIYRCTYCRRVFEQDSRGFQGFYFGLVASLGTPFVFASLQRPGTSIIELGVIAVAMFLLMWPVYVNMAHYIKAPVLARQVSDLLLPEKGDRTIFGRIVGGESRFLGLLVGISCAIASYMVLAVTAVAIMRI